MSETNGNMTIFDVAKYIFEKLDRTYISQITLYKLLWFCQGWHYRITGNPFFNEEFEAWEHGPVPTILWSHFKGKPQLFEQDFAGIGKSEKIAGISQKVVDKVLENYGDFTSSILRVMSHQCDPWKNNYRKSDQSIPNDEIREYFCKLK